MSAKNFKTIEGQALAIIGGQPVPLSAIPIDAIWVMVSPIINASGTVTCGMSQTPTFPASFMLPPVPPKIPGVLAQVYYDLSQIFVLASDANDGVNFIALIPGS